MSQNLQVGVISVWGRLPMKIGALEERLLAVRHEEFEPGV